MTIILDFRLAIFGCRNRWRRAAAINGRIGPKSGECSSREGEKAFRIIPLPFIPLTSFLAFSKRDLRRHAPCHALSPGMSRFFVHRHQSSRLHSNQLDGFDRGVPKLGDGGKIFRVGNGLKLNKGGTLPDFMWRWVSDIVSYCQIMSSVATFGHLFEEIFFCMIIALSILDWPSSAFCLLTSSAHDELH
jgi:hypothetical protein